MFKIRVDEVKRSLLAGGSSDEIKTRSAQGHSQSSHQRLVELRKRCPWDKLAFLVSVLQQHTGIYSSNTVSVVAGMSKKQMSYLEMCTYGSRFFRSQ